MAEGVADSGGAVSYYRGPKSHKNRPDSPEPAADPASAPHGWMWDEGKREWRARKRPGRSGRGAAARAAAAAAVAGAQQQPAQPESRPHLSSVAASGTQPEDRSWADPDPAHMHQGDGQGAGGGGGQDWDPRKVSRETKNEIEGMLGLFYSVPADFLITMDPYCFGALNDNLDKTIQATVPIICRSKMAVEFVTGASGLILWIKLMSTLKPFLVAVWHHHVTGSVELEREVDDKGEKTGAVIVHKQDYSAYTAA